MADCSKDSTRPKNNNNSNFAITEIRTPKLFANQISNIVANCTKTKSATPLVPPRPSANNRKFAKRNLTSPESLALESPSKRITMDETRLLTLINEVVDKAINPVMAKLTKLDALETKMDAITEKLDSLNNKVTKLEGDFQFMSDKYDDIVVDIKNLQSNVDKNICPKMEKLNDQQSRSEKAILDLQCRSMRENLLLFNIPENSVQQTMADIVNPAQKPERENGIEVAKTFFEQQLKLHEVIILDRAHRVGKFEQNKNRPLVVKFQNYSHKEMVLKNAMNLKGTPYAIAEQFPQEIVKRRKILLTIKKELADKKTKSSLAVDKLYVSGKLYTDPRIYW
jgi:uncharacterized protein YoxC